MKNEVIAPKNLWDQNIMSIPEQLITDYVDELTSIGRLDDAKGHSPDGEIGGETKEETEEYFVHRFAASAVRSEFFLLDVRKEFGNVSKDLLEAFSGGEIAVLDVPCGGGASILGFLSLLHELRKQSAIPRLPLHIAITAGDYSVHAHAIYGQMLTRAQPWLQEEGITIEWVCHEWNVKEEPTTAAIVDSWFLQAPSSEEWVVLICSISGALATGDSREKDFAQNSRFFHHICSRLHDRVGTAIWIEPGMKRAVWLTNKIAESAGSLGRWFVQRFIDRTTFFWMHPIKNESLRGNINVLEHKTLRGEE